MCLVVDMVTGDSGTLSPYAVFWFLCQHSRYGCLPLRDYVLSELKGDREISPRLCAAFADSYRTVLVLALCLLHLPGFLPSSKFVIK